MAPSSTPGPMQQSGLLPLIRAQVRERLLESPAYLELPRETQLAIAHDTVKAFHYILGGADGTSNPSSVQIGGDTPVTRELAQASKPALPEGDTAGSRFREGGGAVAAAGGADALADLVSKINFPKFVAGLIDGVFNAIVSSSIKQMEAYAELVKNVSKSADQYMKDNVTENNARDYLTDRYPETLELDIDGDRPKLKMRDGVDENNLPDFQGDLGTEEPIRSLDDGEAEQKLVRAARRRIAMDRQQLLATMVMMGVNRLVVTNGSIEASCLFELDTKDEVKRRMQRKTTSDWASKREGESGYEGSYSSSGFLGLGDDRSSSWYGKNSYQDTSSFKVSTTRSEDSDAKVQMHAKLTGKVNVQFKSDYFPMEKMVDVMQINQIRSKTPAGNEGQPGAPSGTGAPPARTGTPATPAR
jgi:hypothetical protein